MTGARIIAFPSRAPFAVDIVREGAAWLVVARQHGFLHGSRREAVTEAREIAHGFGVPLGHIASEAHP